MSTVCDSLRLKETSTVRGLSCVQPRIQPYAQMRGWRCDVSPVSPMRPERVSRVPSVRVADSAARFRPPPSSLTSLSSMPLAPGSVKVKRVSHTPRRWQCSHHLARQVIPIAADVAPVGVAPVG
jgi:hypothetical protein